ncbi:MAG TPA: hypothetical protein VFT98_20205 [Myxococcota bacterium]|nr:hypothetical protein [Myxococcota bacterium]
MRRAARRDNAEPAIVAALVRLGCHVLPISSPGAPDLLVGWRSRTYLLEVKTGRGKRTPLQEQLAGLWNGGPLVLVRTVDEALRAVGAMR